MDEEKPATWSVDFFDYRIKELEEFKKKHLSRYYLRTIIQQTIDLNKKLRDILLIKKGKL